jgi:hypothetical protein
MLCCALNFSAKQETCSENDIVLQETEVVDFAAWTMHFQIMMKERPTKCIFKVCVFSAFG